MEQESQCGTQDLHLEEQGILLYTTFTSFTASTFFPISQEPRLDLIHILGYVDLSYMYACMVSEKKNSLNTLYTAISINLRVKI